MDIAAHTPHSNRTCAINAYGLTLYSNLESRDYWLSIVHTVIPHIHIRCAPYLHLLSQTSTVLWALGLPDIHLTSSLVPLIVHHTSFQGNSMTSAVPINYLSSTSPSSLTGGCQIILTKSNYLMLSATNTNVSTISSLIIISQLNHFTFVSALLLPVQRLNLVLPLRLISLPKLCGISSAR